MILIILTVAFLLIILAVVSRELGKKNVAIWILPYIHSVLGGREKPRAGKTVHVYFCFVDHFEPMWNKADIAAERSRVEKWTRDYPLLAARHRDSDGKPPQHTFFFPQEEYRAEHLTALKELCSKGFGDVEVHLHHDNDTSDGLRKKLLDFCAVLDSHGFLKNENGKISYAFIHGNWALDNSRPDGRWCGVNDELKILKETGCYADFTLPSAPSDTQTSKINSIYYAVDDIRKPKSHDSGVDVQAGRAPSGDLMIIQGPLALNWKNRKWGILPRIENGEITHDNPPSPDRIDLWIRQHIHVKGRSDVVFVKVHTHGCQENDFETLLGDPADKMYSYLEKRYNDGRHYQLHYVTARQMFEKIKELEGNTNG